MLWGEQKIVIRTPTMRIHADKLLQSCPMRALRYPDTCTRTMPAARLCEERAHRLLLMNTLNSFGEQRRDRQYLYFITPLGLGERNRVSDNEPVQGAVVDQVDGIAGHGRVSGAHVDVARAAIQDHACRLHRGA